MNDLRHNVNRYEQKEHAIRMSHHIVIVEDEPVTQARLQAYFEQEGYHVSVTASATGLREIMSQHPVDLILLDINLPDENGLMLTRALRERSTVGIILVTGRSDQIDRIVGLEMGADDYVTKPLELRELVVRVKKFALAYRSCPPGTAGDQR
ncbi:Functional role page for TorCAD operon transcriptional regulatory protein TorR [Citrobacter freundii]|uniref:Functional role page for TorCAD operon transcriptional regulatory protein TorR n=1 Tax=Citrobacter freundii TaxID=546 RepID=A0A7G2IL05_CITFR|nr:Functional role page for TorCAD operon transcriptional regulatory protein TorR [Citrobacter freundii]